MGIYVSSSRVGSEGVAGMELTGKDGGFNQLH